MGAFYDSIHVRVENSDAVQAALVHVAKVADCQFYVGPILNDWVNIFPHGGGPADQISAEIARRLPNDVLHLILHDDDIFSYYFYRGGSLIDHYNSCPDYFGEISEEERAKSLGHPELLQDLLLRPKSLDKLKTLLASPDKFTFKSELMSEFAELFGLSNACSSYEYFESGERDEIISGKQFIHIKSQPVSAEDYHARGELKRARGDLDGAVSDYDQAIKLNPNLVAAQDSRSLALSAKTDRDKQQADLYYQFAAIKKAEGDLDAALHGYDRALALNPRLPDSYNNRALIRQAKGDLAGAMVDFDQAINLNPDSSVAHTNRGELKRSQGDLDGALIDFDRAIELKPDMAAPYNNRAEVKRTKGFLDDALVDFNRAIELKPDSATLHNNRGELKRVKGDLAGALIDYDRALELQPDLASALNNRGLVRQMRGDLGGSMDDFNRVLELQPNMATAYNNRGQSKKAKGDLEGAWADYNRAIELRPGIAEFHANRGELKRIKGELNEAILDFDRALQIKPNWAEAYNNRGEAKRAQRDLDGAGADYNRALEINPRMAAAYNNRGLVERVKGNLPGALADFNKTLELAPGAAQAYCNRGLVKQALGDLNGARTDYNKALKLQPSLAAARKNLDEVEQALTNLTKASSQKSGGGRKTIPVNENAPVLRTDFSDEAAWESLCLAIRNPDNEFEAYVDFISDPAFKGVTAGQLLSLLPKESHHTFAFVVDHITLSQPDHPILVVNLMDEPGRTFRVIPSELWNVENNLSIANMGFEEFAEAVDETGVFRGF